MPVPLSPCLAPFSKVSSSSMPSSSPIESAGRFQISQWIQDSSEACDSVLCTITAKLCVPSGTSAQSRGGDRF